MFYNLHQGKAMYKLCGRYFSVANFSAVMTKKASFPSHDGCIHVETVVLTIGCLDHLWAGGGRGCNEAHGEGPGRVQEPRRWRDVLFVNQQPSADPPLLSGDRQ
jgi:hypothetical protein